MPGAPAEMYRLTGPCTHTEEEALEACEELRPWMRREFGWPLTELGNIRLRKGDLAGGEEALPAAHANSSIPQHRASPSCDWHRETPTAATTLIADAIDHPFDIPSKERPPYGGLRLAPLLAAQVEIAFATGDLETARRVPPDELSEITTTYSSAALSAGASARRRVGQRSPKAMSQDAWGHCERAAAAWIEIGAPYEAAEARMVLGEARQATGNTEGAVMEWRAARQSFEEFGAVLRAREAERVLNDRPERPSTAPRATSVCVFRCDGDTRTVRFDGTTVLLHDLLGFRYLERLLAEPNREFHVLDLVAVERGSLPTVGAAQSREATTG